MRSIRLLGICLVLGLSLGCSSSKPKSETIVMEPVRANSPAAQKTYDEGLGYLGQGRWSDARELFLGLQSEFPDDPIAAVAELYIGRAMLGNFDVPEQDLRAALSVFAGLSADDSVDSRVRFAALVYRGSTMVLLGQPEEALDYLALEASPSLSPNVIEADRKDAWALLIEAFSTRNKPEHTILASERAISEYEALRTLALPRAFEAIESVPEDVRVSWTSSDSIVLRALSIWHHARLQIAEGKNPEDLSELVARGVMALRSIGENEKADELGQLRAVRAPSGPLRIGLLLPQSGPNRAVGKRAMRGAMLAKDAFDPAVADGITLVVADAAGDLDAAFKMFEDAGVVGIVGPLDASKNSEISLLARKARIPVLSLTNEIAPDPDSWVFRNFLDAETEARLMAQTARQTLGQTEAHVVYPDIGYGRRMASVFQTEFESLGGTVKSHTYDRNARDYSSLASKVSAQKPQAIFIPDSASKVAELSAFLANANVWGKSKNSRPSSDGRTRVFYLGTSLWRDPLLLKQAKTYVQGAIFPVWLSESDQARSLVNDYKNQWESEPNDLETFTFDSIMMVIQALENTDVRTGEELREFLLRDLDYVGATGRVTFSENGASSRTPTILEVGEQLKTFEP